MPPRIELDTGGKILLGGGAVGMAIILWLNGVRPPDVSGVINNIKDKGIEGTASGLVGGVGETAGRLGRGVVTWLTTEPPVERQNLPDPQCNLTRACRGKYVVTTPPMLEKFLRETGVTKKQIAQCNSFPVSFKPGGAFCFPEK